MHRKPLTSIMQTTWLISTPEVVEIIMTDVGHSLSANTVEVVLSVERNVQLLISCWIQDGGSCLSPPRTELTLDESRLRLDSLSNLEDLFVERVLEQIRVG